MKAKSESTNPQTIIIERKVTKVSYEKIAKSMDTWPQWKKNLCNEELIISINSKKV